MPEGPYILCLLIQTVLGIVVIFTNFAIFTNFYIIKHILLSGNSLKQYKETKNVLLSCLLGIIHP